MKEITRIHIAKTPYDIEIAAKKSLESYMKSLESYSGDKEIINDIEIRITEILAERGVLKDGVISGDDVAALKSQLGEPHEFMSEGDMAVGAENDEASGDGTRKLYRDTDRRVVGGVLAGIAAFFKINPAWVRLVFIVVALASFGTALLVYIVLWVAVPPARTAADKLQMAGRPVTVNSIRELNESEAGRPVVTNSSARRIATVVLGVGCVIGAVIAAIVTIFAVLAVVFNGREQVIEVVSNSGHLLAASILALASGLLLVVMFVLGAYASFAQKMTRRVLVSLCVVIVLGLVSFGTAIGLSHYSSEQIQQAIEKNTRQSTLQLPAETKTATALSVDASDMNVEYIVSEDVPAATLRAFVKDGESQPNVSISLEGRTLKVKSDQEQKDCMPMWGCRVGAPTIIIHGPELTQLTAGDSSTVEYTTESQRELTVNANQESHVTIVSGAINTLNVVAGDGASISADGATVSNVSIDSTNASDLELGSVRKLQLTDKNACPANSATQVEVWNISDQTMEINGVKQSVKSIDSACTELDIRGDER